MAKENQKEQPAKQPGQGAAPEKPKTEHSAKKKSKQKKHIQEGIIYVLSTFNNTIITVTDKAGNAVCWSTCGNIGFKGSKKSTPFAAQLAASAVAEKAKAMGLKKVEVCIKGPGAGRESAVRAIQAAGLQITAIRDVTPIPHNGCRASKRRRV
ncbi:MAG: 30S ribosomal protein S11 [Candidatus Omnitrophica bacterium]|nr:30S ribosomal protein S11 [Candidatus Omnitrophota bacterium]